MKRLLILAPVTVLALSACGGGSGQQPTATPTASTASVRAPLTIESCKSIYLPDVYGGERWLAPGFDVASLSVGNLESIISSYEFDAEHVPAYLEGSFLAMQHPFKQILDAKKAGSTPGSLDLGGFNSGSDTVLIACQEVGYPPEVASTPPPSVTPAAPTPASSNTIDEGTWTVGVDVKTGTYRTVDAVEDGCYWAITKSGSNGGNIIANDNVTGGHPSVTLSKGQDFKTQDCGTWTRAK